MIKKDLLIIGGGAAGLSAAVYAARAGMDFVLVDTASSMGSAIARTSEVENYTGFDKIDGIELISKFRAHAEALDSEMLDDEVQEVTITDDEYRFLAKGNTDEYRARSVIYCTGAGHRKLGVKGESELLGRGVGYCAVCDGFFYRGKVCAVVGGGNTAVTDALYLSRLCSKVYLIHRRDTLRAEDRLIRELEKAENIEILYNAEVEEILGTEHTEAVRLKNGTELELDGVFIAVGITPQSKPVRNIALLDDFGYVKAGEDCTTSQEGLFVAGDVRTKALRQIITACADGANAVRSATDYLKTL